MLAITHMAFGFLAGLVLKPFVQPEHGLLYYGVIIIASILPDIDHSGSTINRICRITKILPVFFKHRGFFHSVWPAGILAGLAWQWSATTAIAMLIGYGSHLLGDSITRLGVNWLYPVSKLRIQGPMFTGGITETIVLIAVVFMDLVLILR